MGAGGRGATAAKDCPALAVGGEYCSLFMAGGVYASFDMMD